MSLEIRLLQNEMDAADLRIVRSLLEAFGDDVKNHPLLNNHVQEQESRRKQLRELKYAEYDRELNDVKSDS